MKKTKNGILLSFLSITLFLSVVFVLAWLGSVKAQNHRLDKTYDGKTEEKKQTELERATKIEQTEINKETFYTVTEGLECGNTRVEAITTCGDLWQCSQKIYFINPRAHRQLVKQMTGDRAYDWSCAKDNNKELIAIDYGTGGNCVFCEWREIYDAEGNLLMSDYFDPHFAAGKITSEWWYCAETYLNYSSGFHRDQNLLKAACQTLNKSEFEEMKAILKQWEATRNKIASLIDKKGNRFATMRYIKLIREEYDHKRRRQPVKLDRNK